MPICDKILGCFKEEDAMSFIGDILDLTERSNHAVKKLLRPRTKKGHAQKDMKSKWGQGHCSVTAD